MPLGEVLGRDAPAVEVPDRRAKVVDRERDHPRRNAGVAVEEGGHHEQRRAEQLGGRDPEQGVAEVGVVPADDRVEDEMDRPDEEVREPEEDGVVSEGARNRERDEEHRAHGGEHREPDTALVDVQRAREPRVAGPRPPERGEHEHAAEDAAPGGVVHEQARDLREREHERKVEEELERGDPVLVAVVRLKDGSDTRGP